MKTRPYIFKVNRTVKNKHLCKESYVSFLVLCFILSNCKIRQLIWEYVSPQIPFTYAKTIVSLTCLLHSHCPVSDTGLPLFCLQPLRATQDLGYTFPLKPDQSTSSASSPVTSGFTPVISITQN